MGGRGAGGATRTGAAGGAGSAGANGNRAGGAAGTPEDRVIQAFEAQVAGGGPRIMDVEQLQRSTGMDTSTLRSTLQRMETAGRIDITDHPDARNLSRSADELRRGLASGGRRHGDKVIWRRD